MVVKKEDYPTGVCDDCRVTSHPIFTEMTEYWVEVKTGMGKNLAIFKWDEQAGADYLLRQIQRWSGQEH